ncbi:epoxide hydrolase 1 isoform X2 [Latimeria chalumnae]|uniref:epoxide hydrolase 1 isoform X2 n=1 Tax=Latimeria chalumnae TaxID=7897 RepID=UPI00313AFD41
MQEPFLKSLRSLQLPDVNPLLTSVALGAAGLLIYFLLSRRKQKTLPIGDGWWGPGVRPVQGKEDKSIRPYQVEASNEVIQDLYRRLDQARFSPPLEDSRFHYGFNSTYLRQVVSYWRDRFDWNKQVDILNKYPHFKTQIEGFDSLAAARIFYKLMQRLGFEEFYLQGGDWGGLICTNIAQMIPEKVKGLHLNFFPITKGGLKMLIALILGPYLPFLVGFTKEDVKRTFPFFEKNLYEMLRETGYMHIQGTKPDSAGCGLNDSPVGLAAYILEKFSTWTDKEFRDLEDGGLERKFSLDDLLTNVMIYWVTGTIVSSMRLYKENLNRNLDKRPDAKIAVYAPTGIAAFPNELIHTPWVFAKQRYKNIVSFSYMPRGGHFAAFEEPALLAQDLRQFVRKLEKS